MPTTPSETIFRVGRQTDRNLRPSTYVQMPILEGEALAEAHGITEFQSITGSLDPSEDGLGPIDLSGLTVPREMAPEEDGILQAGVFGAVASAQIGATGAWTHTLTPSDAETNRLLAIQIERGTDPERVRTLLGLRPQQCAVNFADNGRVTCVYQVPGGRSVEVGEAAQTTGTSAAVQARGYVAPVHHAADKIVLTVIAVTGTAPDVTEFTVEVSVGTGTALAGTDTVTVVAADPTGAPSGASAWTELWDHQASPIEPIGIHKEDEVAAPGHKVEARWDSIGNVAVGDVWEIDPLGQRWTLALPVHYPLSVVYSSARFEDDTTFELSGGSLTYGLPTQNDGNVFGLFSNVDHVGEFLTQLTLNRRQIDAEFVNKLQSKEPFRFELHAKSGSMVASGDETTQRRMSWYSPRMVAGAGTVATVSSVDSTDETISATAYPSTDPTYPAQLTLEIVNSLATI